VIVAPGSTAPLSSFTRPLSWAVDSWADETAPATRTNTTTSEQFRSTRPIDPSIEFERSTNGR
jgi:hypothetical protein